MKEAIQLINQAGKTGQNPGYGKFRHTGTFVNGVLKILIPACIVVAGVDFGFRGLTGLFSKNDNRGNDRRNNDRNSRQRY